MKSVNCDVVVCGGGIAGCAAAIQAARSGARTILLEKTVFPGGLATSGLVYIYMPLCDGFGNQLIHGLGEELLFASIQYGPGSVPKEWKDPHSKSMNRRFFTKFSPASFVLGLDEKLEEAKVDVWFDTLLCAADVDENRRVRAVEVENKSGRIRIEAKCFVDATGDADLARFCGAELLRGVNKMSAWTVEYDAGAEDDWHKLADPLARYVINEPDPEAEAFSGISGRSVSRFIRQTRSILRKRYRAVQRDGVHNRENFFPLLIPSMADFRTTFFIKGKIVLDGSMEDFRFEDSIGVIGDWTKPAPGMELPYRALVPEKIGGLLAAGRCISVKGESVERTRVIPVAAMTGQTAGYAAAMAAEAGCLPGEIPVRELQKFLETQGFILHRK